VVVVVVVVVVVAVVVVVVKLLKIVVIIFKTVILLCSKQLTSAYLGNTNVSDEKVIILYNGKRWIHQFVIRSKEFG
jgi:hypothetical protein